MGKSLHQEIHFSFLVALGSLDWSWVELNAGLDPGQLPRPAVLGFGLTSALSRTVNPNSQDGFLSLCECLLHERRKLILRWHQGWKVTDKEKEGLLQPSPQRRVR